MASALPPLYAHRLGRHYGPDSSAAALRHTLTGPVEGLETDVCLTADDRLVLRMVAVRPTFGLHSVGLPVVWRARTWSEPETMRLRFQHLGGVTAGMDVTWRIEATPAGCHVTIDHTFRRRLPIPILGGFLGDEALPAYVDRFFTRPIARRTLASFKALAEGLNTAGTSDQLAGTYPIT